LSRRLPAKQTSNTTIPDHVQNNPEAYTQGHEYSCSDCIWDSKRLFRWATSSEVVDGRNGEERTEDHEPGQPDENEGFEGHLHADPIQLSVTMNTERERREFEGARHAPICSMTFEEPESS